jgi:ribonuclease HI
MMDRKTTMDARPAVELFTDGACTGNPGPGGWGFVLRHPASGRCREGSGGEHDTTNNRMEITAVIRGLEALKCSSRVEIVSDSEYVVNAISDWMARWKRNGWRKSPKAITQVKNADLWRRLDELLQVHAVTAHWVRGHVGHAENERCDRLATAAAAQVAATPVPPHSAVAAEPDAGLFGQPASAAGPGDSR